MPAFLAVPFPPPLRLIVDILQLPPQRVLRRSVKQQVR